MDVISIIRDGTPGVETTCCCVARSIVTTRVEAPGKREVRLHAQRGQRGRAAWCRTVPVRMHVAGTILTPRPDCSLARRSRMTAGSRGARHIASCANNARSVAVHVASIDRDRASPEDESRASRAKPGEANGMRTSSGSGSIRREWGDHVYRKSRRIHGSTPSHPDRR